MARELPVVRGFQDAVNLVCSPLIEGGYANDPKDPGKETNFGVSKAMWDRAVHDGIVRPGVAIKDRSRDEAVLVYRTYFWDAYRIGELPYPLGLVFFDTIVNHSPTWSIKSLQMAIGIKADGVIGASTILAANETRVIGTPDRPGVVIKLLKLRMKHYLQEEPPDIEEHFELGWANRLLDIQFAAIMAATER